MTSSETKSDLPKISVVTPSFNQGRYIKETIESVLSQNYPNFEHIIMDGGSTDETVEILKSYPHLNWRSESDRGQSDALNKALQVATGDIVAWINSDDCFLPGAFHSAAEALQDYPIVMGDCLITDDHGKIDYSVENIPRSWFDLLKYWIPYSIPTQPAIFFRRSLLASAERFPGEAIDTDLHYTMDYDLWIRLAVNTPLARRIKKPLATYRMTENNKTGPQSGGLIHAEPEMSRVFHRAETLALSPSFTWSVVICYDQVDQSLRDSITSVLNQGGVDLEILLAPIGSNSEIKSESRAIIREYNLNQRSNEDDRYLRAITPQSSHLTALQKAIESCEGRYVQVLRTGDILGDGYLSTVQKKMCSNKIGFVSPLRADPELGKLFGPAGWSSPSPALELKIDAILEARNIPIVFACRKIALIECADLADSPHPQAHLRRLFLEAINRGWHISAPTDLPISITTESSLETDPSPSEQALIAAFALVNSRSNLNEDPFQIVRLAHGIGINLSDDLLDNCRTTLKSSGPKWNTEQR